MPVKAVSMLSETLLLNSYLNLLDRLIQIRFYQIAYLIFVSGAKSQEVLL